MNAPESFPTIHVFDRLHPDFEAQRREHLNNSGAVKNQAFLDWLRAGPRFFLMSAAHQTAAIRDDLDGVVDVLRKWGLPEGEGQLLYSICADAGERIVKEFGLSRLGVQ